LVGANERFLGEIVSPRGIATSEMTEETPHGGLMTLNELPERVAIVRDHRSDDQF
jgi:hypothetical protein